MAMENDSQSLEISKLNGEIKVILQKNKTLKSSLEQSLLEIKRLSEVIQAIEARNGESSKSSAALNSQNSAVITQLEAQMKQAAQQSTQKID